MYLATGGDDSAIVIWVQKNRPVEFGSSIERVVWSNYKILRGHLSDVYDLAWSPDSKYLISGSVDNRALIWSLEKAKVIDRSIDHRHFVQGVSWDPRNKYITTQSSDKSAKIYTNANIKNDVKFYQNFLIKKYFKHNNYDKMLIENLNIGNELLNENNENINDKMQIDDGNLNINDNDNNNDNYANNNLNKDNNNNLKNKQKENNSIPYFADEIQSNS